MTATISTVDLTAMLRDFITRACPANLHVNPFFRIKLLDRLQAIAFEIEAPIPAKGLAQTVACPASFVQVHSLLIQILMGRLFTIDTASAGLVQELKETGVVLPAGITPIQPTFTCTATDDELAGLREVRFVGRQIRQTMQATLPPGHGRLPDHHVTWLYDYTRQLQWPYWLTASQLEHLSTIAAQQPYTEQWEWDGVLEEARCAISRQGCAIMRRILPAALLKGVQRYYRDMIVNGFLPLGDKQSHRYHFHNEPLACWLHQQISPLIERIIPEPIKPSYAYLGFYLAGAVLEKHTDREQCEYTLSLTIDAAPSAAAAHAWPLCADLKDGTTLEALLGTGDGLIFKGRELPHYRHRLSEGRHSSSVFFHYVPEAFTGSLD